MIQLTALKRTAYAALACVGMLALGGCQNALDGLGAKANVPVPKRLVAKMKAKNMAQNAPIMLRIFKDENKLEVWKRKATGRYALLTDYEICKWSGKFGPKFKEGDRQAPEGFYSVNKHQMNPNSQYHLAMNMGFPNAYDRSHGRTGTHLMIHGACSSAGCYSMTDEYVQDIFSMARDSFKGGQKAIQIQAYPFRPTAKNMAKHRDNEHFKFWSMLKRGYDHFEITNVPPKVDVCDKRYEFNTASDKRYPSNGQCPARKMPASLATSFVKKHNDYALQLEKLVAKAEGRQVEQISNLSAVDLFPGVTLEGVKLNKPEPNIAKTTSVKVEPKTTVAQSSATGSTTKVEQKKSVEAELKPAG